MKESLENTAWKKSNRLLKRVNRDTACFPEDEKFCLTVPLRQAAHKVSAHIAKGSERKGRRTHLRALYMALSALKETRCFLMLAHDLGYLTRSQQSDLSELMDETRTIVRRWILSLKRDVGMVGIFCAAVQSAVLTTLYPLYNASHENPDGR